MIGIVKRFIALFTLDPHPLSSRHDGRTPYPVRPHRLWRDHRVRQHVEKLLRCRPNVRLNDEILWWRLRPMGGSRG